MKNTNRNHLNKQQDSSQKKNTELNQNTELKQNTVPVITKDDLVKEMNNIMNESQLNKENLLKNLVVNTIPANTSSMEPSVIPELKSSKEPFTLSTITSFHQVRDLLDTNNVDNINFKNLMNIYCKTFLDPVPVYDNSEEPSLYDLIFSPNALVNYLNQFIIQKPGTNFNAATEKRNHLIMALILRQYRFVLRFITVDCTIWLVKNTAISQKLQDIFNNLRKKRIYLNFEKSPFTQFKPTIESTMALIVKELTVAEKALKEIIPAVLARMGNYYLPYMPPKVAFVLDDIAPFGLLGVEKDYYYPIRLFSYYPNNPILNTLFSPEQLKQWLIYREEVFLLYSLVEVGTEPVNLEAVVFHLSKTSINLPFKTLLATKGVSNNTYSRLINVNNMFIQILWETAFIRVATMRNDKRNKENHV